jgi:hypothetical protein
MNIVEGYPISDTISCEDLYQGYRDPYIAFVLELV